MNLIIAELPETSNFHLDFSSGELSISPVTSVLSFTPQTVSLKPVTRDIFLLNTDEDIDGAEITPHTENVAGEITGSEIYRTEEPTICPECGRMHHYHIWMQMSVDHGAELCLNCLEKIYVSAKLFQSMECLRKAGN